MKLIAVAAMSSNCIIGHKNQLPWHLPDDLKFFKSLTLGKTVLMGRNTFESIIAAIGKPLPKRRNIVFSNTIPKDNIYGVEVVQSLKDICSDEVFLIGGEKLYRKYLDVCDELYLSLVYKRYDGDTSFPRFKFPKMEVIEKFKEFEIRKYTK